MKKQIISSVLVSGFVLASFSSAFAQTAGTSAGKLNAGGIAIMLDAKAVKVLCIQNALEKREVAIITAHDVFNTNIKNALTARKDGLKTAYVNTEKVGKENAKKTAWSKFKTDTQSAHSTMRSARVASWNTFNTEMNTCGEKYHNEKAEIVKNPTYAY
jgi:hypothetical protein